MKARSTTKVYDDTLKKLRFIKAYTEETMIDIIDRLADAELKRITKDGVAESILKSVDSSKRKVMFAAA